MGRIQRSDAGCQGSELTPATRRVAGKRDRALAPGAAPKDSRAISKLFWKSGLLQHFVCRVARLDIRIYREISVGYRAAPNLMIAFALPVEYAARRLQFLFSVRGYNPPSGVEPDHFMAVGEKFNRQVAIFCLRKNAVEQEKLGYHYP